MKKRWLGLKGWAGAGTFLKKHEQGEGGLNLLGGITSSLNLVTGRLHMGRSGMSLERQTEGMES